MHMFWGLAIPVYALGTCDLLPIVEETEDEGYLLFSLMSLIVTYMTVCIFDI